GAARRQSFRKLVLALAIAQRVALDAQRAVWCAGVALATVVCAARRGGWRGARARCLFIG
ncbi:hypothetical protein A2U01_0119167, partial [Trifolium medium]|nr:hypothetical protein [Trifolium medium]